jgi:hypothetical protein
MLVITGMKPFFEALCLMQGEKDPCHYMNISFPVGKGVGYWDRGYRR